MANDQTRPQLDARAGTAGSLPELGVGVVYNAALAPLLAAHPELIDVLEVEPQTTWMETSDPDAPYLVRPDAQNAIAALPWRKLVHSVGTPVGGSTPAHAAQIPLLREAIERFEAPWASEHLSFNMTADYFTGFFLPPRQTDRGLAMYAAAISRLRDELGVPIAVETGVNYLRPRTDEMPDGEFMAAVAQEADCGILLDLHNIYCNARNGRQAISEFLSQIPLERVWEVHLAGGFELDGFWLDAHSGAIPEPLEQISREIIPHLPGMQALVFELFSSFVPGFGLDATRQQLERIRELWMLRRTASDTPPVRRSRPGVPDHRVSPAEWEQSLGAVVIGRDPVSPLGAELAKDPGAQLVRSLVHEFRASMVVSVYRLTSRLLMLTLGPDAFRHLLEDFWSIAPPHQFAGTEADAFADYILTRDLVVPDLESVLGFERAALGSLRDGQARRVPFSADPLPLLRSLAAGSLPSKDLRRGEYVLEVTDEGPVRTTNPLPEAASQTTPFH